MIANKKLQPRYRSAQKIALVFLVAALSACGGGGGDAGNSSGNGAGDSAATSVLAPAAVDASYFPIAIGDRWVYRSWSGDDQNASSLELVKVSESLDISGREAKVLRTYGVVDGGEVDAQYLAVSDNAITFLVDPTVPPGALVMPTFDLARFGANSETSFQALDKTLMTGNDSDGDGRSEQVRIKIQIENQGLESVQTDAGSFENCLRLNTTITQVVIYTTGAPSYTVTTTVRSWYARGVGLVKEDSETQRPNSPVAVFHQTLSKYSVGGVKSESVAPKAKLIKPNGLAAFSAIELEFDEDMDMSSISGSTVRLTDQSGKAYPLTASRGPSSFSFYPAAGPLPSGTYTATVGGAGTDLVGNLLSPASWTFEVDATAPDLVAMNPKEGTKYVPLDPTISLTFTEALSPESVSANVLLLGPNGQVPAEINVKDRQVTIQPYAKLLPRQTYSVGINYDLKDKWGNRFGKSVGLSFETDPGQFDYPTQPNGAIRPNSPEAVAIGDVNGDGRKDVVIANSYYFNDAIDYKLFVYYQGANGLSSEPVLYPTNQTHECRAYSVAVGDLNGDGRQDVVQAEAGCGMEIFYQTVAGKLESAGVLASPESRLVRLADVNRDGRLDMIGVGWGTNQVAVWIQQPNGTMSAPQVYALEHAGWESLAVGDLNSDGRVDIVVSSGQGDASKMLGILYQLADGAFGDARYIASDTLSSVSIADFNGDGRNDLVGGRLFYGGLGVALQDATGKLGEMTIYLKNQSIELVRMADLDRDGRQELIVLTGPSALYFYRPQLDGSIQLYDQFYSMMGSNPGPESLEIADVNGDDYPDIVTKGLVYWMNRPSVVKAASSITNARSLSGYSGARALKGSHGRFPVWMSVPVLSKSAQARSY